MNIFKRIKQWLQRRKAYRAGLMTLDDINRQRGLSLKDVQQQRSEETMAMLKTIERYYSTAAQQQEKD